MEKLRFEVKKYFEDPNDPIIEKLSEMDLNYIDEYMKRPSSNKKIHRIRIDSDKLEINPGDDDGNTYFRNS